MNRKRRRKDILCISKRHMNRLNAQESELIYDSLLCTTASLHGHELEYAESLRKDSSINAHIIDKHNKILTIENGSINNKNENNVLIMCDNDENTRNDGIQSNESNSEQSSGSISHESISCMIGAANTDNDFKSNLASWAIQHQISHTALGALLQQLRQHSCFSKLPTDARSLLKTPRKQEIRFTRNILPFWITYTYITYIDICEGY